MERQGNIYDRDKYCRKGTKKLKFKTNKKKSVKKKNKKIFSQK